MKIFLDLTTKTVQIIDGIGFDELEDLKKFLGEDYKSWKIEPTAEPLTIRVKDNQPYPGISFPQQPFPNPIQPYYGNPIITVGTGTGGSGFCTAGTGSTTVGFADNNGTTSANNGGTFTCTGWIHEVNEN